MYCKNPNGSSLFFPPNVLQNQLALHIHRPRTHHCSGTKVHLPVPAARTAQWRFSPFCWSDPCRLLKKQSACWPPVNKHMTMCEFHNTLLIYWIVLYMNWYYRCELPNFQLKCNVCSSFSYTNKKHSYRKNTTYRFHLITMIDKNLGTNGDSIVFCMDLPIFLPVQNLLKKWWFTWIPWIRPSRSWLPPLSNLSSRRARPCKSSRIAQRWGGTNPPSSDSMDWFKGKSTGNHGVYHQK